MDYEALLKRYIAHVRACEGVDYIDQADGDPWGDSDVEFSDAEIAELRRLSDADL